MNDEETIYQMWLDGFNSLDKEKDIHTIADQFPNERTLNIDFQELEIELQDALLEDPDKAIRVGESAIRSLFNPDQKGYINLRILNLYQGEHRMIKDLRSEDQGKMKELHEINVTFVSDIRPKILTALFSCTSCGFKQKIEQDALKFTEPLECPKDDGGCGKRAGSTTFKFSLKDSLLIDSQKIEFEDPNEMIEGKEQPKRIVAHLEDDLVGQVVVGDRISAVSIVCGKLMREDKGKSVLLQPYLRVNHIAVRDKINLENVTDEEMKLVEWIKDNNPLHLLKQSIGPHIYGYDHVKTAMGLSWSGGVPIYFPDGSYSRGDIHLLLVGDPSTAKSQLAKALAKLHPRSIFTSGRGNSAAGLTAAVIQRKDVDNRFGVEAGTMVLADEGMHFTDEMDKMRPEDRSSMHDALEAQQITIAKAGVYATMMTRCANIGCANPKSGRYKSGIPASAQIDIEPPILSRHLVFAIMDQPDKDIDEKIAEKILNNRWGDESKITPPIPARIWHIYWYMIRPVKPKGAMDQILKVIHNYTDIRMEGLKEEIEKGGNVTRNITARQLEDIARLAEASARLRMDENIDMNDIDLAIELVKKASQDMTGVKEGWGDQSVTWQVKSKTDKVEFMCKLINDITVNDKMNTGASKLEILEAMVEAGFEWTESDLNKYLKKAKDNDLIFEPSTDYFMTL